MPPVRDADTLAKFCTAFEEWNSGGVLWRQVPTEWVSANLDGCTPNAITCLIREHIANGGEIDRAEDSRSNFRRLHPYHYDFRISISGRPIYIETILDDVKMGPRLTVVSIHDV